MITRLRLDGMTSQYCIQAVFTSLTPVPGIIAAEVGLGSAVIEHDGRATGAVLRDAIAVSGYTVLALDEDARRLPVL